MKTKLNILILLIICCFGLHGQSDGGKLFGMNRTSMVGILEALSNTDIIIQNKRLAKSIKRDMKELQKRGSLNYEDYEALKVAYENLRFVYNDEYLAQMKLDLSDVQNYKKLMNNPGEAATTYMQNYGLVADVYNDEFLPVLQEILYEDEESADFITVIKVGFKIFKKIVAIIKERKLEKADLLQIGISEANEFLFRKLQLPEWDTYGISRSEDVYEEESYEESEYIEDDITDNNQWENGEDSYTDQEEGTSLPPMSTATIPYISGQFYFEVYDDNTGGNIPLNFQVGPSQKIEVPNYGQGDMAADLIVGKPRSKTQSLNSNIKTRTENYMASFESALAYPIETYYQIKTSTDGFTYIFAVNSGNKMYSFYPYQGAIENIPFGVDFSLSDNSNALQNPDGSGNAIVSIPDEENYLMTYDVNGIPPIAETLVVLFSKSELNLRAIFQQLESMEESRSPEERLAQILGTQAASLEEGAVQLLGDTFTYQLTEEDPIVLPLVFAIKRR